MGRKNNQTPPFGGASTAHTLVITGSSPSSSPSSSSSASIDKIVWERGDKRCWTDPWNMFDHNNANNDDDLVK